MVISFGREICGSLDVAESREWLVTNGIGGYASGAIANLLTRRYHGLLIAALKPPLGRTLMLAKLDETAVYSDRAYPLYTNRWADGTIEPHGYKYIERFHLEGATPVWRFACADAILEKRIWMHQGANTTYIHYTLPRATKPLTLAIKALVNYRDYHYTTCAGDWQMNVDAIDRGICVRAFPTATPLYLRINTSPEENLRISLPAYNWHYGFDLAVEQYRGLNHYEDHLHAATFHVTLKPGAFLTLVASTERNCDIDGEAALELRRTYEQELCDRFTHVVEKTCLASGKSAPENAKSQVEWVKQLALAADQFIVDRPLPNEPDGKTIIAGYPWFSDWGRDTMISLPGLTLSTGRFEIARSILRTFSRYVDGGMLPNRFPDAGDTPEYNTVDATLWYFEAIRAYYEATGDEQLLAELWPTLADIIHWHERGTRYNIHLDPDDGLIYAGGNDLQLTWMDAKIDNWVVTPRTGKPVEISALWYNALQAMKLFAQRLGKPHLDYEKLAQQTAKGFTRFWNEAMGYCYDVLDGPDGHEALLRPNQIFAVSLAIATTPQAEERHRYLSLLTPIQEKAVVDAIAQNLLTSHGLRSLSPHHPQYQGIYGGDPLKRDSAYHQGTVWGWPIGAFVLAHLKVYKDPAQARELLEPMADHLCEHGVGSLSEIFDGDPPMQPRGCFAQAWTVAEVLRAWLVTNSMST